ncbi:MAG: glycosyltransferase family 4 protein [Anaerolineales bacterium]|nr:glycosyltransferase family 4 protein [Anaerolineales bacterium]MCW5855756.1 glycosyltransferase family 4 protein [Anaerolineales bacterium]
MASRPRIAVISDTAPPTSGGGVGVAHYNLVRALHREGYPVQLFLFFDGGDLIEDEGELTGLVHRFGTSKRLLKLLRIANGRLFGRLSPGRAAWNVVDIFGTWPGMLKVNKALAKFAPDVIVIPDHGAPALWLRKPKNAEVILIAHHNPMRLADMNLEVYSELDARWAVTLEQRSLRKVSKVISPSRHMQEWFLSTYDFEGEQAVIPNLVIAEDLQAVPLASGLRSRLGLPDNAFVICVPSAQAVVKGTRLLPDILTGLAEKLRRPFGVFIPGELDAEFEKKLPFLPEVVRLYTPGRLTWQEYIGLLKSCSLGMFLSLRDNYSMSLVEATHCGVPMVAFDAGGNADIVSHGVNGLLFDEVDIAKLTDAVAELADAPEKLEALRNKCLADASERFDSQKIVKEYLRFIED